MVKELYPAKWRTFTMEDGVEKDNHDNSSLVVLAYQGEELVGGGRVIKSDVRYIDRPEELGSYFADFAITVPPTSIAEMGSLFVLPQHRCRGAALAVWKARFHLCRLEHITHVFVKMSPKLWQHYKFLGLHFTIVSRPWDYHGLELVTTFTKIDDIFANLQTDNPALYNFFQETQDVSNSLSFRSACNHAIDLGLEMPPPEEDGKVRTLNYHGFMDPSLEDNATSAFLDSIQGLFVLEIGCTYGNVMQKALELGVGNFTGLDLDLRHLQLAAKRIYDETLGSKSEFEANWMNIEERAHLVQGKFPSTFFPSNTFDRILATRVFHFLNPEEHVDAFREIHRILKLGGKMYLLTATRFLDPLHLKQLCNAHNLHVDFCEFVAVADPNSIWRLNGRENVLIASKR
jgi:SAM-dependent methyltransferase